MPNSVRNSPPKHKVAIVLSDNVVLADAMLAYETFNRAVLPSGERPYCVFFCAAEEIKQAEGIVVKVQNSLDSLSTAETIVIPGVSDITHVASEPLSILLHQHIKNSKRLISFCTGAFVLASCGLLDGLEVTTHWMHTADLEQMYRKLHVNPDVLYIDNGQILTSAGALAGIDLCLYVIELDFGSKIATELAKISVVHMHRRGGQKQFINHNVTVDEKSQIYELVSWIEENINDNYSIEKMAKHVCMSPRTFNRKFKLELGLAPFEWLKVARIKHAKQLLESTNLSVEQISYNSGLGSPTNMRRQFQKSVGISPREYRKAFHHLS